MAGRGTDILLGGNPDFMAREFLKKDEIDPDEVTDEQWRVAYDTQSGSSKTSTRGSELGGLHIIGTERHESRRIDNQLRGRAGRQGDPGSSRFFLSLEDDLMRIFAGDKVKALMQRLGMEKGRDRVGHGIEAHRGCVEVGRRTQLRSSQTPARIRRRHEQAARDDYGLRRQLMEEPDQREYLMGDPPSSGVAYDLVRLTRQYLNPDVSPTMGR